MVSRSFAPLSSCPLSLPLSFCRRFLPSGKASQQLFVGKRRDRAKCSPSTIRLCSSLPTRISHLFDTPDHRSPCHVCQTRQYSSPRRPLSIRTLRVPKNANLKGDTHNNARDPILDLEYRTLRSYFHHVTLYIFEPPYAPGIG